MNFSGLIILTGVSGIGKTPLLKAAHRFYPKIFENTQRIILYNDRQPRPIEQNGVDYFFLTKEELERKALDPGAILVPSRADLQVLDIGQVLDILEIKKCPLFEGNPYVALTLKRIAERMDIPVLSVFISPLSSTEIQNLKHTLDYSKIQTYLEALMFQKLTRRTLQQYGYINEPQNQDNCLRAAKAFDELSYAWEFGCVIPNQDGEDSEHWNHESYPQGSAGVTLGAWVDFLLGIHNPNSERWDKELCEL